MPSDYALEPSCGLDDAEPCRGFSPSVPRPDVATAQLNKAISRSFLASGRQDLNLRPPGPQPERSRRTHCCSALRGDLSCPELPSVALNLDPELDPVHNCARDCASPRQANRVRAPHSAPPTYSPMHPARNRAVAGSRTTASRALRQRGIDAFGRRLERLRRYEGGPASRSASPASDESPDCRSGIDEDRVGRTVEPRTAAERRAAGHYDVPAPAGSPAPRRGNDTQW